ncbi:hypothetical protein MO398_12600 [Alistipes dispar]|uniref:hypothetical protein n=1 Tax=Alistipes sp. Marseille-P2263 TaxID=2824911 RepID=UPI001B3A2A40|nr:MULTISPECIES: hypothetical protein [Alistipes]MBQ4904502.1 hypothetical protein [Alistipes sp. Marseille-P2263]MCI2259788.1 hypothetical protein [Alistipes dispar]
MTSRISICNRVRIGSSGIFPSSATSDAGSAAARFPRPRANPSIRRSSLTVAVPSARMVCNTTSSRAAASSFGASGRERRQFARSGSHSRLTNPALRAKNLP